MAATTVDEILARPYTRVVERGADGVYTSSLVEIPGAIGEGDSYAEALEDLDGGLRDVIEVMIEMGQPISEPLSQQTYSGRLQLRLTPSLHARASLYAQLEGVSLNRVLSDAVASYVGFRARMIGVDMLATVTPGTGRVSRTAKHDIAPAKRAVAPKKAG